jgi:hypothetical protein
MVFWSIFQLQRTLKKTTKSQLKEVIVLSFSQKRKLMPKNFQKSLLPRRQKGSIQGTT